MEIIKGTVTRQSKTDYFQRCAACGRLFYFSHDCNRKTVQCPHCYHNH